MDQDKRARKILLGTALTAGLLALGLTLTGNTARALSLVTQSSYVSGFHVPSGSSRAVQQSVLNGRPITIQLCAHPGRSPASVLAHYVKVARAETPARLPFLLEEFTGGGGGNVIWTTQDGTRKAVLVSPDPRGGGGGAAFRLIAEEPQQGQPTQTPPAGEVVLPGGLYAPGGFEISYCLTQRDGTGTAVLQASGSCRDAAAGLLSELERRGFTLQREARAAYQAHTPDTRLILPFAHRSGALAGHLVVSPNETGGARACLTVREGS